jgi:hypothetical protein
MAQAIYARLNAAFDLDRVSAWDDARVHAPKGVCEDIGFRVHENRRPSRRNGGSSNATPMAPCSRSMSGSPAGNAISAPCSKCGRPWCSGTTRRCCFCYRWRSARPVCAHARMARLGSVRLQRSAAGAALYRARRPGAFPGALGGDRAMPAARRAAAPRRCSPDQDAGARRRPA